MLSYMELIQIMSFNAVINITTESILGFAEDITLHLVKKTWDGF